MEYYEVFSDVDGIFADWRGYVLENHFVDFDDITLLNKHPLRKHLMAGMYALDPNLFYKLEVIEGSETLLGFLEHLQRSVVGVDVNFLTAMGQGCDHNTVDSDKRHWLRTLTKLIGSIIVPDSPDKVRHCHPRAILIDDFKKNCDEWTAAGGIAIHIDTEAGDFDYARVVRELKEVIGYAERI